MKLGRFEKCMMINFVKNELELKLNQRNNYIRFRFNLLVFTIEKKEPLMSHTAERA